MHGAFISYQGARSSQATSTTSVTSLSDPANDFNSSAAPQRGWEYHVKTVRWPFSQNNNLDTFSWLLPPCTRNCQHPNMSNPPTPVPGGQPLRPALKTEDGHERTPPLKGWLLPIPLLLDYGTPRTLTAYFSFCQAAVLSYICLLLRRLP